MKRTFINAILLCSFVILAGCSTSNQSLLKRMPATEEEKLGISPLMKIQSLSTVQISGLSF
jgi:hypothetical protein